MPSKRRESLDKFNQGFLHVIINDSVSGKSNAAFGMTRHRSNQIGRKMREIDMLGALKSVE